MIYHLKLQPSEIENLEYYEYHYFTKDLTEVMKRQQKGEEVQQEQQNQMMQNTGIKAPKINVPSIKMPSMKMPR